MTTFDKLQAAIADIEKAKKELAAKIEAAKALRQEYIDSLAEIDATLGLTSEEPTQKTRKTRKSSGEPRWSASITRAVNGAQRASKSKSEAEKAAFAAVAKLAEKKGVVAPDAEKVKPLISAVITKKRRDSG